MSFYDTIYTINMVWDSNTFENNTAIYQGGVFYNNYNNGKFIYPFFNNNTFIKNEAFSGTIFKIIDTKSFKIGKTITQLKIL